MRSGTSWPRGPWTVHAHISCSFIPLTAQRCFGCYQRLSAAKSYSANSWRSPLMHIYSSPRRTTTSLGALNIRVRCAPYSVAVADHAQTSRLQAGRTVWP